jgi:hypothetical protein
MQHDLEAAMKFTARKGPQVDHHLQFVKHVNNLETLWLDLPEPVPKQWFFDMVCQPFA